jgi:hypothetical protein
MRIMCSDEEVELVELVDGKMRLKLHCMLIPKLHLQVPHCRHPRAPVSLGKLDVTIIPVVERHHQRIHLVQELLHLRQHLFAGGRENGVVLDLPS